MTGTKQIIKKSKPDDLAIVKIAVGLTSITADISDGRQVIIPISWFPRLSHASNSQLQNFIISPSGYGVHWPELDEDISIKAFIS